MQPRWQAASRGVVRGLECWLPLAFVIQGVYIKKSSVLHAFPAQLMGPILLLLLAVTKLPLTSVRAASDSVFKSLTS